MKATERLKLLVVGVGGQGAITAARFLGDAALAVNLPVIVGQIHGMSQRGGSVECPVLIGHGQSSHVGYGEADLVLGLEPLEVQRALPRMSEHTRVVVNTGTIVPFSLAAQGKDYPPLERILADVRAVTPTVYAVDGPALVRKVGLPRTLNVVMLGATAGLEMLPFDKHVLWKAIEKDVPSRYLEANRMAFELGIHAVG